MDATKSFEHIAIPPPGRNVYASSTLGQQRLLNSDSKEGFSFLLNLLPSQLQGTYITPLPVLSLYGSNFDFKGFQLLHLTKEKSWKPYFLFCEFFKSHHQPLSPSYLPWEPSTCILLLPFNKHHHSCLSCPSWYRDTGRSSASA